MALLASSDAIVADSESVLPSFESGTYSNLSVRNMCCRSVRERSLPLRRSHIGGFKVRLAVSFGR